MGHTLRGAVTAWLGLIALQTVVTHSDRAGGALSAINDLIQRALSPGVPAIPDRRSGAAASGTGWGTGMTDAELAQVVAAAQTGVAVQAAGPGAAWNQVGNAGAASNGATGVDWSAVTGSPFLGNLSNLPHG
jgi:hypothetical protein